MACFPYSPALKPPGNWIRIDFADPRLAPAIQMMVQQIQIDISAYTPSNHILLHKKQITVWDGETIDCYIFEPEGAHPKSPAMLYCHGGGFFLPIQPMMMELASQYALEAGLRVYLPEYRILPEHPNPYPFRDCLSILEEIQKQDVPYLLYGESAGGTLAAGLALWTRDHETKPANGQCLIYPVLDNRCSRYASMRLYSEAAWPLKNNLTMWRAYLKNGKDSLDNYIVPMTAPDVSSLSPAYVEPQQIDTLRDEAIAYAKRLEEAGNHVTLNTIEGSYHGFDADIRNPFVQEIVFDHLGHILTNVTGEHEAIELICELLRDGKAWVKLSGIYLDSTVDRYTNTIAIGRRYVQANPDRCLWGTDWPHLTSYNKKQPYPDDAAMLDALMEMAGAEDIFHRILVENPAELFGFGN